MTALMVINTDKVTRFNFVFVKHIFEKVYTDKPFYRIETVNLQKRVYAIEFNETERTFSINGKVFNLLPNCYGYTYRKTRGNNIQVSSVGGFLRHIKDAANSDNVFHHLTEGFLRKLIN